MSFPVAASMQDLGCTGEFGCGCTPPRPKIVIHGSRSSYVAGCRCSECTRADRVYKKAWAELREGKARDKRLAEEKLAKRLYDQERYRQRKAGTWKV